MGVGGAGLWQGRHVPAGRAGDQSQPALDDVVHRGSHRLLGRLEQAQDGETRCAITSAQTVAVDGFGLLFSASAAGASGEKGRSIISGSQMPTGGLTRV